MEPETTLLPVSAVSVRSLVYAQARLPQLATAFSILACLRSAAVLENISAGRRGNKEYTHIKTDVNYFDLHGEKQGYFHVSTHEPPDWYDYHI